MFGDALAFHYAVRKRIDEHAVGLPKEISCRFHQRLAPEATKQNGRRRGKQSPSLWVLGDACDGDDPISQPALTDAHFCILLPVKMWQVEISSSSKAWSATCIRCGGEKLRLAAAISERYRVATGQANVFGFCSGAPPFVQKRKTRSLWLPALVVAVQAVSRCRVQMGRGTRSGQVLASDVAARDVQAATSSANRQLMP